MKKNKLNIFYDKEADVLYMSKGIPSKNDDTSETEDEILVRKEAKTGKIKGFTILHFLKRTMNKEESISLPFQLSFN